MVLSLPKDLATRFLGALACWKLLEIKKFQALRKVDAGTFSIVAIMQTLDFIPYSLPPLVACRLLAAAFYLSQQVHLFLPEASVLHFLHIVHV